MWRSWTRSRLVLSEFDKASNPDMVADNYMEWYYRVSHPYVINDARIKSMNRPEPTSSDWVFFGCLILFFGTICHYIILSFSSLLILSIQWFCEIVQRLQPCLTLP